jgi:hypothetical protein
MNLYKDQARKAGSFEPFSKQGLPNVGQLDGLVTFS